jgi:hypothetical protein
VSAARIAVPDLVSNSYFPAITVIALDLFNREGLDVVQELIFPNYTACHWPNCVLAAQTLPARNIV